MNIGEKQAAEIKTIKERNIALKLSDADVERLFIKAGGAGLTVSELLENFIGDLVGGTYSNGSDERDYAERWFDRCWFSMGFGDFTFLQWLISNDCVDEAVDLWEIIQDFAEQDVLDDDETNDLACARSELADIFNEYRQEKQSVKDSIVESEMPKVMRWWNDLRKMKVGEV
ncbi:molecular chaperone GrpE [Ethanoligenens sp.]|uniref:molecular chaperone GrpE n=1 Tax=Ethanoligenens sp. TaxID=2099655 RepID=UPI0039E782A5